MRYAALTLAAVVLLSGCAGDPPAAAPPAPAATVTVTAASAPTSAAPAPSPTPTAVPDPKVGDTQDAVNDVTEWETTVLRVKMPWPTKNGAKPEQAGHVYAGIEVKECLKKNWGTDPATVGWTWWKLALRDGSVVESASSFSREGWGVPLYPLDHAVKIGRCVRGWIPFEVRRGAKIAAVEYQMFGEPAVEWAVR